MLTKAKQLQSFYGELRRLHEWSTIGKSATDRHNKMFLRLEAAFERALEDPAQIQAYLAEHVKAQAVWKPRKNRNKEFNDALRDSPDWLAQRSNGDFCMPAERIETECIARRIKSPHTRNIDLDRRRLLAAELLRSIERNRMYADAIRRQGGVSG